MQRVDLLGLLLLILGSIMVYGSKYIIRMFNWKLEDNKVVLFKLAGLTIAIIGIFRIFEII